MKQLIIIEEDKLKKFLKDKTIEYDGIAKKSYYYFNDDDLFKFLKDYFYQENYKKKNHKSNK